MKRCPFGDFFPFHGDPLGHLGNSEIPNWVSFASLCAVQNWGPNWSLFSRPKHTGRAGAHANFIPLTPGTVFSTGRRNRNGLSTGWAQNFAMPPRTETWIQSIVLEKSKGPGKSFWFSITFGSYRYIFAGLARAPRSGPTPFYRVLAVNLIGTPAVLKPSRGLRV
ncbi:MAG: hypothetical protein CM15mP21_1290 [Hyphomicrobiales bacterium]|nr:MAG: hypothetical protein CM15mP21_1290 [Hyphomicrobiales bacterium]